MHKIEKENLLSADHPCICCALLPKAEHMLWEIERWGPRPEPKSSFAMILKYKNDKNMIGQMLVKVGIFPAFLGSDND